MIHRSIPTFKDQLRDPQMYPVYNSEWIFLGNICSFIMVRLMLFVALSTAILWENKNKNKTDIKSEYTENASSAIKKQKQSISNIYNGVGFIKIQ